MKLSPKAEHLYVLLDNLGLPQDSADSLKQLLIDVLNEETEACALACRDIDAFCGGHGEPSMPGSSVYMRIIRQRKIDEDRSHKST